MEESSFRQVLDKITGTKESIRQARDWIASRPDHVATFSTTLRDHVDKQHKHFAKVLWAMYLLNDLFFGVESLREGFRKDLPTIVSSACAAAPDEASRSQILDVVELWAARRVFERRDLDALRAATTIDLTTVSVGAMAEYIKSALASGHEPWTPIDVSSTRRKAPPASADSKVVETRLDEFYRALDRERTKRNDKRAARLESSIASANSKLIMNQVRPTPNAKKQLNTNVPKEPPKDPVKPIGDENLGKQMLRGMGWEEGRGLGLDGRGRAEPVAAEGAGQTDKIGIGKRAHDETDIYSQYRSKRGSNYRSRWSSAS